MNILEIFLNIEKFIFITTLFFCLYQLVIVLFDFSKEQKKEKIINKQHK